MHEGLSIWLGEQGSVWVSVCILSFSYLFCVNGALFIGLGELGGVWLSLCVGVGAAV